MFARIFCDVAKDRLNKKWFESLKEETKLVMEMIGLDKNSGLYNDFRAFYGKGEYETMLEAAKAYKKERQEL